MSTGTKGSSGAGGGYLSMATGGNYVDQVRADFMLSTHVPCI